MKNKVLYMISSFIIFIFLFFCGDNNIFASSYEYTIDSYDVDIKVNENNSFDITEKISTSFNVEKHGIYRKIPLVNNVNRVDGTKDTNRAKVKDIEVNDKTSLSTSFDYKTITIGDEDKTYTGKKDYVISYNYNLGKDKLKDKDELYFNIIGTEWDTTISNSTFKITMPKEFDIAKVGFSSGKYGITQNSNIRYQVNGNTITGKYIGTLNKGEGITIRIELPDGYFYVEENSFNNVLNIVCLIIPILLTIIAYIMWYKFGKDKKVIETVEFYPPNSLNSLDLAFEYKGNVNSKDVTSLLIYLANKGYLSIIEGNKKSEFTLKKLKEYDGNNEQEKIFFEKLFKSKDEVKKRDLTNKFYTTTNKIISNVNTKENRNRIFEKNGLKNKFIICLFLIITILCITLVPLIDYGMELGEIVIIDAVCSVAIVCLCLIFFNDTTKLSLVNILIILCFAMPFFAVSTIGALLYPILSEKVYIITFLIGVICIINQMIVFKIIPKRTDYGTEILGKIRGFKNFLTKSEKSKLEELVEQDPKYFYNILPYTYVLGISNKWIKKFEAINIEAPDWYNGPDAFDMIIFTSFIDSTMNTANSAMSSSPSSSSGSSGGGFSGGGSGGGGGGSW